MSNVEDDVLVTIEDLYSAGACALGARRWASQHGFSLTQWLRDGGVRASVIRSTGCDIAERICRAAELRAAKEKSTFEVSNVEQQ